MTEWHVVTGEYPPDLGGVAGYTHQVAVGLVAAGDRVHVWCPGNAPESVVEDGVRVHRSMQDRGRHALTVVDRQLAEFAAPRRLLVQWVPHAYGFRSLNIRFCTWLWRRARRDGDHVEIVVHEASLAFGEASIRRNVAAFIHR